MKKYTSCLHVSQLILLFVVMLLPYGNGCASDIFSPGGRAIYDNKIEDMVDILDSGVSPDYIGESAYPGQSLLALSITLDRPDMTSLLLKRGADPLKAAYGVFRYLNYYTEENALKYTEMLLSKGVKPNQPLNKGVTWLHFTCQQPSATEFLLKNGAWVDGPKSSSAQTPLAACLSEINAEINSNKGFHASIASDKQSNIFTQQDTINIVDRLHVSKLNRLIRTSLILLKFDADPNADVILGNKKIPLLFSAYQSQKSQLINAILDSGADVLATSESSKDTCLHLVSVQTDVNLTRDLINRVKAATRVDKNISKNGDIVFYSWLNQRNDDGYTALHLAARSGLKNIFAELIKTGADYTLEDRTGNTAQFLLDKKIEEDRMAAELEKQKRQLRQAEDEKKNDFQWGKLAAIGVGAAIGGLGNLSSEQQTEFISSAVKDSMAGQEGMSNTQSTTDRLSAEQNQRQAILAQQERQRQSNAIAAEAANNERLLKAARDSRQPNGVQNAVSPSAERPVLQVAAKPQPPLYAEAVPLRSEPARAPSGPTYSGAPCGPGIRCTLGMSGQRHCEPSIPPTGEHCEEGCTIQGWGAAYHDVTLPSDKVYIPTGKLCKSGCTVPNLCSGS